VAESELRVVSAHGTRSLVIRSDDTREPADYWSAELHGESVSAHRRFYAHGHLGLGDFFESLAHDWRGWRGEKIWTALEGDVSLTASHDGAGHVALSVELRAEPSTTRDPDWMARVVLLLEAGSLDALVRQARGLD
jgi:hypothetical protein